MVTEDFHLYMLCSKSYFFFYTLWCHRYKNLSLFPSFKITIFNIFIFCQLVRKSILYTHFNCSTWQILIVGLAFSSLKFFTRHCTIINGCLAPVVQKVDSAIQLLNNWGPDHMKKWRVKFI